ncbi:Hint domain-containing protein [Tropicimonas sediminicola]|uniref:Hint domain-containing protein n=1 Tax=Tropicimonas sediminicola TaxID=1031541 RepID=A0A239CQZ2_9RHOB|nr:Hint domain-containing protein [Tropicimonas sediminicola]SNS21813.1 Hint domain-containing protein [Tropicimonas sediminicola]
MSTTYWARFDSNSANNPALNLTGDPSVEITFVPSGPDGDIILEGSEGVPDPDTQVVIDGVSYDFSFAVQGTLPTTNNNGANQVPVEFRGADVIVITVYDYPTPGDTARLSFMPGEEATEADMENFGNGAIDIQNVDETGPGEICFAAGTLLMTPKGPVPVEDLAPGDLLVTRDGGALPIRWVSFSTLRWPGARDLDRPMQIRADTFGPGAPARDLVVSPQHRVLLGGTAWDGREVLAPARGLAGLRGVREMKGCRRVTYYHVLLPRHAVILSEGLETESFLPGPMALRMLTPTQRAEVLRLFPALLKDPKRGYGAMVRPCVTVGEARDAVRAHPEASDHRPQAPGAARDVA